MDPVTGEFLSSLSGVVPEVPPIESSSSHVMPHPAPLPIPMAMPIPEEYHHEDPMVKQAIQESLGVCKKEEEVMAQQPGPEISQQHQHQHQHQQVDPDPADMMKQELQEDEDYHEESEDEDEEEDEEEWEGEDRKANAKGREEKEDKDKGKVDFECDPRKVKGIFEITQIFSTKMWKCRACSYLGKERDEALEHLKTTHMRPRYFKCNQCGKIKNSKGSMSRHISAAHSAPKTYVNENGEKVVKKRKPRNWEKNVQCPRCDMKFVYKKILISHLKKCISSKDCGTCGKTFLRRSNTIKTFLANFKRHEKSCAVNKERFRKLCPYCHKEFKQPSYCRQHMKSCEFRYGDGGEEDDYEDDEDYEDEAEEIPEFYQNQSSNQES